jgi:RNA polymerase-binding protein DksA
MKKEKERKSQKDFAARMREALIALRGEILENLASSNEDLRDSIEAMNPKDVIDAASDDTDRKVIEALGAQELKRLRLIESALGRIDQDKYGLCIKCGKQIPETRLEAIPYAVMCRDCKNLEERRNR